MHTDQTSQNLTNDPLLEATTLTISANGKELQDKVLLTMSVNEFWYVLQALDSLRLRARIDGTGDPDPLLIINALHAQCEGFWVALRS